MQPIIVEHRRTLFSERSDVRALPPGLTVADIVERLPVPAEFASFGAVYIKRGPQDPGHVLERRHWRRIRPKAGTALFVSCVPGNGGEGGKNVFAVIAAIALVALTAWVGAGGLAFLAPAYLGAGTVGAQIAAAAIAVAGSAVLNALTPAPGKAGDEAATTLGVAGIAQNPIRPYSQVPAPLGRIRISPPLLARPYTTIEDTAQFVHLIAGVCGPAQISGIKINETDLADLPTDDIEVETREGWLDDTQLTLIRESIFEETINLEMGKHRLKNDQETLVPDHEQSYPTRHLFRTAERPDEFRLTLNFPQGLSKFDSASTKVLVAFRVRLRRVGEPGSPAPWRNLPEMHIEAAIRGPFRQQLRLFFGRVTEGDLVNSTSGETPAFVRFYAQAQGGAEWTADPYFNASPVTNDTNSAHIYAGTDRVLVYLDPDDWTRGAYDVEIQRSFAQAANSGQFSGTNYLGGLFTFRTAGPPDWTIPNQAELSASVAIESHATVRHTYPIAQPGLALIAVRAKNLRINSVSAEFEPYVPIPSGSPANWDTVAPSSNPAALVRWVRTGLLNKRPSDPDLAEGLEEFYTYCETQGLRCSAVITDGSVEQAASLAANVGDGLIRESDKWGVVVDRDRSAEGVQHLFGAHNMSSPLVLQRRYVQGTRGIIGQFVDESRNYVQTELPRPVFDDGVSSATSDMLVEGVPYDGYSRASLVRRRARMDLRRARLRATRYSWECHQEHLVAIHGDLVGLSHDILANVWGTGRVAAYSTEAVGSPPQTYLRTVTLNTEVLDVVDWPAGSPMGFFEVPDVFLIGDVFTLSAPSIGLQVRLADNSVAVLPVASIDGAALTLEGDVALPAGFRRTLLAAVGPRLQETRRVLITNITPRRDHFALIEAVDEAPAIHAGL